MKWWFSSWNLFLFSLSKVYRLISAYRFISGITASQSPLFCEAKYSGLHFAQYSKFCFAFASKVFLYVLHWKILLKKTFSTCIRLHFSASFILFYSPFLFLRVHERQIISLPYMDVSRFAGVFYKNFYSLTIIGKLRAVCWGISQKFYKKIAENFFSTTAYKKEVRLLKLPFSFLFLIVFNFFAW